VVTSWDREEKKPRPGRLPLILIGVFAIACLVALLFLGDLARYQEAGMVEESQATLRDVNDYQQLDQALKQHPANRILKLVALANDEAAAVDAATLAKPVGLTAASRSDLDALRRDLKTVESNAATVKTRTDALIKAKRGELEKSARSLGIESNTVARYMAAIDEQHAEIATLAAKTLAAWSEYYGAFEKCTAVLVKEFGSYKVTNGQFIFRVQPTADSYNAALGAMAGAQKRMADLEDEKTALKQSQLNRWKKFVGG
jgi:hypothetical protein